MQDSKDDIPLTGVAGLRERALRDEFRLATMKFESAEGEDIFQDLHVIVLDGVIDGEIDTVVECVLVGDAVDARAPGADHFFNGRQLTMLDCGPQVILEELLLELNGVQGALEEDIESFVVSEGNRRLREIAEERMRRVADLWTHDAGSKSESTNCHGSRELVQLFHLISKISAEDVFWASLPGAPQHSVDVVAAHQYHNVLAELHALSPYHVVGLAFFELFLQTRNHLANLIWKLSMRIRDDDRAVVKHDC